MAGLLPTRGMGAGIHSTLATGGMGAGALVAVVAVYAPFRIQAPIASGVVAGELVASGSVREGLVASQAVTGVPVASVVSRSSFADSAVQAGTIRDL